jgi:hypothetical protein
MFASRRLLACTRLVGLPPWESNVNRRMNNLMMHSLYLVISFLFLIPSSLCIFHNSLHLPSSSLLFQFQLMSFILLRFFLLVFLPWILSLIRHQLYELIQWTLSQNFVSTFNPQNLITSTTAPSTNREFHHFTRIPIAIQQFIQFKNWL